MFVLGNFLIATARVLQIVLNIAMWIIVIQALLSWVNPDPYNPIVRFLYGVSDPILRPIRKRMPASSMGFDLSPIVAILIIIFLQHFLVVSLLTIGNNLR